MSQSSSLFLFFVSNKSSLKEKKIDTHFSQFNTFKMVSILEVLSARIRLTTNVHNIDKQPETKYGH